MINKIIIDDSNVTLNESTAFPFTYTFSKSGVHKVKIGLEDTDEICDYAEVNDVSSMGTTAAMLVFTKKEIR